MPKYRDNQTGRVLEFDHEPTPQELEAAATGGPSTVESVIGHALPVVGGVIGGKIPGGGPIGAGIGAAAGQAYTDLYHMIMSATGHQGYGAVPTMGEEAAKLATVGGLTAAGERYLPGIMKQVEKIPGGNQLSALLSGTGLGYMFGHPQAGAAAGVGLTVAKSILPRLGKVIQWAGTPTGAKEAEAAIAELLAKTPSAMRDEPAVQQQIADIKRAAGGAWRTIDDYVTSKSSSFIDQLKGKPAPGQSTTATSPIESADPYAKIPYGGSPTGPAPYRPAAKAAAQDTGSMRETVAQQARQLKEQQMEQGMLGKAQKYAEGRQASRQAEAKMEQGMFKQAQDYAANQKAAKAAKSAEDVTRQRISDELGGMERGQATASETLKAPGMPTVRIPYGTEGVGAKAPAAAPTPAPTTIPAHGSMRLGELTDKATAGTITADELAEAKALTQQLSPNIVPKPTPDVAPPPADITPTPTEPQSSLAQFFKTPQGATGANYGAAKDAVASGDILTADYARDSHLMALGKEPTGPLMGLRQPGIPPHVSGVRTPSPAPEAPAPSTPATTTPPASAAPDYPAQVLEPDDPQTGEAYQQLKDLYRTIGWKPF